MTGPSSAPRGERAGTPGANWETSLTRTETVIADDAPEPQPPSRGTRRALKRAARRKTK